MAINFPNSPIAGNTVDYQGVRYTYNAGGYWEVTTVGTIGIATGVEITAGTEPVKYITPKTLDESDYISLGNDGAGSGLDADKLDGQHASNFVNIGSSQVITGRKTLSSYTPGILLNESDQPVDERLWLTVVDAQRLQIQVKDDSSAVIAPTTYFNRNGGFSIGQDLFVSGNGTIPVLNSTTGNISNIDTNNIDLSGTLNGTGDVYLDGDIRSKTNVISDGNMFTNIDQLVYSQDNSYMATDGTNGFQILGNMLIIQWGSTPNIGYDASYTVTLPVAMPNVLQSIVGTRGGGNSDHSGYIYAPTTTTFTIRNNGGGGFWRWIAIGY